MGISKSVTLGTVINFLDNTDDAKQKLQEYFKNIQKEVMDRIDSRDITLLSMTVEIKGVTR